MNKEFIPTEGNIIVFQKRAQQVGSILIARQGQEADRYAEVKAIHHPSEFKVGETVFFDRSAGTIISDTDDGIYLVVPEEDILCIVNDSE